MNGSGGDSRVYGFENGASPTTSAATLPATRIRGRPICAWARNSTWAKCRQLEILAESFNLFNHQNVTEIGNHWLYHRFRHSSSPPTLNFLTGLKTSSTSGPIPGFGQPLNINGATSTATARSRLG